jgi:hypothetical protein
MQAVGSDRSALPYLLPGGGLASLSAVILFTAFLTQYAGLLADCGVFFAQADLLQYHYFQAVQQGSRGRKRLTKRGRKRMIRILMNAQIPISTVGWTGLRRTYDTSVRIATSINQARG